MAQNFQVVIVGAGLSGLRAAREVHNAGPSYIVLEAMDRVGGKTLSVQASDGNGVVDLGASWINDTSQSEIYKLAKEFGFDLVEQRTEGNSLYRDEMGQVHCIPFEMPAKLEPEQLKEVEQFMQILSDYAERCDIDVPSNVPDAKYLDSMTVAEFIAGFKDPSASALVNNITRSLLGVESDEPSALFFLDILKRGTGLKNVISDFKDGAQYLRSRQGNQTFCDRLAAGLNAGSVKISSAVKAITQKEGEGCLVETINGDVYRADRVIVSVPTPLYPLIHFEPSLPPTKKKLGDSAKSGYYTKTILVYAEPWWHSAGLSGVYSSADGPVVFTHDTCVPQDDQYSITCFHAGDPGRKWSRLPAEERKRVVLQDISTAFGTVVDDIPEPINVIEKDWTKDPWAQGGPGPVWRPGFLAGESGKAIAEPFGNIHFVGTETSSVWRGYMDGAVRSGIRGGQEVVTSLDKTFGSTTRGADETDGNHNSSVGPYMQGNQDGLRLHECISPPLLNPLPKVAAMTTQSSELNGVTNSSSVWGDFVDSDGECDVEDACEPINRYEEGLYLPICICEVIAGRYRIEHKLGHGGFSTVWMAYDMHKGKDVALKIMTADPGGEREFLRQNEIISYLNSANVMFGLSSFETGADLTTKYQILGRPQKIELPRDQETWKDGELVAPMTPKDSFVVQDTITLGDFGLAIRSGTEVDFKLQVPVGYCAPERMHQINPTFASDMWSYMCIFAELYLKWPLFGPGFFGGGFRFVAELFVRVLGPLPLSWKGSYDGDGEPDESWYDQSKIPEPKMSLESRVTQSRDTVEPAEQ
ncbi:hypothetical protein FOXB_00046 [Fusarium oxysporum f. sp. conglutinans Fo5176]|uniref:Amine oxidase n=1 Tax=Fusarium oxysporum (strain Fo5176) TaxID=660025 RepID=F9F0X2_FUSOF|nr:hypothetical protein FOXB_00046 [Fusarium oxysporum f. sp. conglutinans Fo5176]